MATAYEPDYLLVNRKARRIHERLLARGIDRRSNGYLRAFLAAMRR